MSDCIVGVDLGGTQMRAARFDAQLNLIDRVANPTLAHEGPERVTARLLDTIAQVMPADGDTITGIGVSVPGPINPHDGTIVAPPNLPGMHNAPIRDIIQTHFDCPTYLGNDANVAALAEATRGAAQGYRYMIYLTISTGIGSGIINNGRMLVGAQGLGAEAGHIQMVVDGDIIDLEGVGSGTAIGRQARERLAQTPDKQLLALAGGNIENVTAKVVGKAAAEGNALAIELIARAGYMVGLGIVSLMHLFNPQIIVIGGGVTKTGDLLFEPMRKAIREHAMDPMYYQHVPIVQAALGDNVALIGAAALVATRGGSQIGDEQPLTAK